MYIITGIFSLYESEFDMNLFKERSIVESKAKVYRLSSLSNKTFLQNYFLLIFLHDCLEG